MCTIVVPHNSRRDEGEGARALCVTLHFSKRNGYERIEYAGAMRLVDLDRLLLFLDVSHL